ncbi:hypothetical protein DMI70_10975 [Escherichia coli]|nr:hypothetical protein [Escherichia coli]
MLWCVYWGVWLVCHKEGLGYGDFKLLAAAGAWCGWQTLPMILLIASLGGIGYAIVSQLLQRRTITTIAFGPRLALGSMINPDIWPGSLINREGSPPDTAQPSSRICACR